MAENALAPQSKNKLPWYEQALPMEGRAAFLPFQDTMPGSVMNQRSWALPGIVAGAVNAFTAPGRAYSGSDPNFNSEEEAANFAMNVMGGGMGASRAAPAPVGSLGMNVTPRGRNQASQPWEMSFDKWKEISQQGVLHQATRKAVPGEATAKTPLKFGELNKYSQADIARFYYERRGGDISGYQEYVRDAIFEGKNVPNNIIENVFSDTTIAKWKNMRDIRQEIGRK